MHVSEALSQIAAFICFEFYISKIMYHVANSVIGLIDNRKLIITHLCRL